MKGFVGVVAALLTLLGFFWLDATAQTPAATISQVQVLDRNRSIVSRLTDGDTVQLAITLPQKVVRDTPVSFGLAGEATPVATCTVLRGEDGCQSPPFLALGWRWDREGRAVPRRIIRAMSDVGGQIPTSEVEVRPRPVVLVHGMNSNAAGWGAYLGPKGFLAALGLPAFAVGDGQVEGVLNTGSLLYPTQPTATLDENAKILSRYIEGVKRVTGAEQVDLIGHSLGGLISRDYIGRVMATRDVAQLITLGSPHQGTPCGSLPAALGYFVPTTLEIRPSYIQGVFNQQVTRRRGVPFYVGAGTRIFDAVQSPCTAVPSDLVVGHDSAVGLPAPSAEVPLLHTDLNSSYQVFGEFVGPILRRTVGEFPEAPDLPLTGEMPAEIQFTRVFSGHVPAGGSVAQTVRIDQATVASFALYDPTQSLTVTVRGATGNIIRLDPVTNGLIAVNDPATLVHLGYGFRNPRPGAWEVTLRSTDRTPSRGADYALTAQLTGGAVLTARIGTLLPRLNEPVELRASLELGGAPLNIQQAQVVVRAREGAVQTILLAPREGGYHAMWEPGAAGLHGLDFVVTGAAADGSPVERSSFLTVEVQPSSGEFRLRRLAPLVGALAGVGGVIVVLAGLGRRRGERWRR